MIENLSMAFEPGTVKGEAALPHSAIRYIPRAVTLRQIAAHSRSAQSSNAHEGRREKHTCALGCRL